MSTFISSPSKQERRCSVASGEMDADEFRKLAAQGRRLLETVQQSAGRQHVWSAELQQCYKVAQRRRSSQGASESGHGSGEEETVDNGEDDYADVRSMTGPAFSTWLAEHNDTLAISENDLGNWFHLENLAIKTPFAAVVPCPGRLTEKATKMMAAAMDGFGFPTFYIQTIPIGATLSAISRAFVPSPAHVPEQQRSSKSDLGPFTYVGTPCTNGAEAIDLLDHTPALQDALHRTPVLLLNDYCPRVPMCLRVLVVAGKCVAAEVACDEAYTPLFGVVPNDGEERHQGGQEKRRASRDMKPPAFSGAVGGDVVETATDVLAFGLDGFVTDSLGEMLGLRSYEAIILADVKGFDPRVLGPTTSSPPYWPHLGKESVDKAPSPFTESGLRFYLLNIDTPQTKDFELFSPEELRVISGYIHRQEAHDGFVLPPVVRFLDGQSTPDSSLKRREDQEDGTPSRASVSSGLHESENAAKRRRKVKRRRHDNNSSSRRDGAGNTGAGAAKGDMDAVVVPRRAPSRSEDGGNHTTSDTASVDSSVRLPSRLSSFSGGGPAAEEGRPNRHTDPTRPSRALKAADGNHEPRKESIYTEERPQYLRPSQVAPRAGDVAHRGSHGADTESTRSSRLPDRLSSHRRASVASSDAYETQSTRSSLPARRASVTGSRVSGSATPLGHSAVPTEDADTQSSAPSSNHPRVPTVVVARAHPLEQESPEQLEAVVAPSARESSVHSSEVPVSEHLEIDHEPHEEPLDEDDDTANKGSTEPRDSSDPPVPVERHTTATPHSSVSFRSSRTPSQSVHVDASEDGDESQKAPSTTRPGSDSDAPQVPVVARTPSGHLSQASSSHFTSKSGSLSQSSRPPTSQAPSSRHRHSSSHPRDESSVSSRHTSSRATPSAPQLSQPRAEAEPVNEERPLVPRPDSGFAPAAASVGQSTWRSPNSSAFRSARSSQYTTPASRALPSEMFHSVADHSVSARTPRNPNTELSPADAISLLDVASSRNPSAQDNAPAPSEALRSCREDEYAEQEQEQEQESEEEEEEEDAAQAAYQHHEPLRDSESQSEVVDVDVHSHPADDDETTATATNGDATPSDAAFDDEVATIESVDEESEEEVAEPAAEARAQSEVSEEPEAATRDAGTSPRDLGAQDAATGPDATEPHLGVESATAEGTASAPSATDEALRRARLMAMSAVVTAQAALDAVLKASKKEDSVR